MPIDFETEKHRGFAFIEFELQEDAQATIDNMNDGDVWSLHLLDSSALMLFLKIIF